MGSKRRLEITVETHRVAVIRRRGSPVQASCGTCSQPVRMITADEAAALSGVTIRTIYRWVEAEKIHFSETPDGLLLICLSSLTAVISDE